MITLARSTPVRLLLALAITAGAGCAGCQGTSDRKPPATAPAAARGPVMRFAYEGVDGRPISTEAFQNRISVIAFLTTYDVHSQVVARFLASVAKRHTPRINAAAIMLEAPENKTLVEAFGATMGLPYPLALADAATIAGEGPFAGLHHVPSIVILDRQGREAFRHVGFIDENGLEAALKQVEKSAPPAQETP
ncbi:hypothetical protein A7982_12458 [Minicystis rosea]|nr:hypothetical protein A7982_12458 [Minicystis rosea]